MASEGPSRPGGGGPEDAGPTLPVDDFQAPFPDDAGPTLGLPDQDPASGPAPGSDPPGGALPEPALPPEPVDPHLGRMFGNYRVERMLGRGGMGAVYLAEQPRIGKRVAIKILHPHVANQPETLRRFFHEARLVNQIRHDHLIDVLDFGEDDAGVPYLVMELLEGESLAARLKRGPLPEAQARSIGAQVARALDSAHLIEVVHRDLKPDNVFLAQRDGDDCFVKLLDFGIAKLMGGTGAREKLTAEGAVVGTPLYISPEQIRGTGIGPWTDLYALGCILFEMVAGRPPFVGPLLALFNAHMREPPPRLAALGLNVSLDYERIALTCLAKAAEQRFKRAIEVAEALDRSEYARTLQPRGRSQEQRMLAVTEDQVERLTASRNPPVPEAPAPSPAARAPHAAHGSHAPREVHAPAPHAQHAPHDAAPRTPAALPATRSPAAAPGPASAEPAPGSRASSPLLLPAPASGWRRWRWTAAGAGLALVGVILIAVVVAGRGGKDPEVVPPPHPAELPGVPIHQGAAPAEPSTEPATPAPSGPPGPSGSSPHPPPEPSGPPRTAGPVTLPPAAGDSSPRPRSPGSAGAVLSQWALISSSCPTLFAPQVNVSTAGTQLTIGAPGYLAMSGVINAQGNFTVANGVAVCQGQVIGTVAAEVCLIGGTTRCQATYRQVR